MIIHILLIEDNMHKRERILGYLKSSGHLIAVKEAYSFTSGFRAMTDGAKYDLVIMDMSLPTYDKSSTESGGRFRTLGGREVARKARRKGIDFPILFLTQYNAFSEGDVSHTLETMDGELRGEFGKCYLGIVQYDSSQTLWKDGIGDAMDMIEKKRH